MVSPATVVASTYSPETTNGIVTAWEPLITLFKPDTRCSTEDFHINTVAFDDALIAYDPNYVLLSASATISCLPTEVRFWYSS
jgi:hypothetical protein